MRHYLLALLFCTGGISSLHADRVAVIGGGGAGVCSAWLLDGTHDVTLYERRDRLGGHADSISVPYEDGKEVVVEAGFEFFTKSIYPTFFRLLEHFDVEVDKFTLNTTWYSTDGDDVLILPPVFNWRIELESLGLDDIDRMLQLKKVLDAGEHLVESGETGITLKTFIDGVKFDDDFKDEFLFPFLGAAWGVTAETIKTYSAYTTLKYLVHGSAEGTFEWNEVVGGLKRYIDTVVADMPDVNVKMGTLITDIDYANGVYTIKEANGSIAEYDHIVIATHADQAGELIKNIPECEDLSTVLRNVTYYDTIIAIHGDRRFMPHKKRNWRLINTRYDGENAAFSMYKKREGVPPIFKTWITYDIRNDGADGDPLPNPLYKAIVYKHAGVDLDYYHAQRFGQLVQGNRNLWFAGAWMWDNDSHESAVISAINVAKRLAPASERLRVLVD